MGESPSPATDASRLIVSQQLRLRSDDGRAMYLCVLGSAAGGAFPQWNCGCTNCDGFRKGTVRATARTQASLAVSADGQSWFLLNASPDVRLQIEASPALHPRARRHTPIAGILLTNGDLDHCLGLLSLRENQPLHLYATERVRVGFTEGNTASRTLERFAGQVRWHHLKLHTFDELLWSSKDQREGLAVTVLPIPGKVPLHLAESFAADPEDNVGVLIRDLASGKAMAYLPSVARWSADVETLVRQADCVFFDGTFWSGDELSSQGVGSQMAEEMAHWPLAGPAGSLRFLAGLSDARRILIHINNTNPILREDSQERQTLAEAGIEVAYDGMEVIV